MKTILTNDEIHKLFYQRIDNVSVHTKHKTKNGNYGKELKNGFLHCDGKLIGICNKDIPFIIRFVPTEQCSYSITFKFTKRKYRGEIEYNEYIIPQDSIEGSIITLSDILKTLWNGVNINLIIDRYRYIECAHNKHFACCSYYRIRYKNSRKGWKSAFRDIYVIAKKHNLNINDILDRYWTKGIWWVEYKGFKRIWHSYHNGFALIDNIRNIPTNKESLTISGKIIYWENIRQKPILNMYYSNYESFKRAWDNTTGRKFIKSVLKQKQEEFCKCLAEKQAYEERLLKNVLVQHIEDFRNYKIKTVPYKVRNVADYAVARLSTDGNSIELWNGNSVTKGEWIALSQFVADCSASNIQLSNRTCGKYKIIVGSNRIYNLEANDLWNVLWLGCRFNLFEITRICRLIGYSLIPCKITRKKLLSQFERN